MKRVLCVGRPEKAITRPTPPDWTLPVILFLTANLETVVKGEGLVSLPVCQLHSQGVLPLAGQLVDVLVPQPVLSGQAPETLRRQQRQGSASKQRTNPLLREHSRHINRTSNPQ